MRESLGIAISEACGIKTMKCELISILKEYRSKLCCPPRLSRCFCSALQTSRSSLCESQRSLHLQVVRDSRGSPVPSEVALAVRLG